MHFWQNPEFVRHVRAELRPARAMTAAVLALVICALVGLSSWGSSSGSNPRDFFQTFYLWIIGIQYVVLTFWCASACGHAISRERELKTYDFLKTTRLTAAELMVGKLLGVPILAYFTVGCSLPISIAMGILGGYSLATIFWTYLLLLALGLFVSIMALWASMQLEGTSARSVGLLVIIPISFTFGLADSPFPGIAALSIFPALFSLYGSRADMARVMPTLFGKPVSFVLLTVILYAAFGAWFALMLIRNLKKDTEEIRLLSRWQAIGFAAFLNVLFYAFLDPKKMGTSSWDNYVISSGEVSSLAVRLNIVILFVIGITMLAPHEKLKVWWRNRAAGKVGYLSESGPPWPWLVPAALIAYAMLVAEALGLQGSVPLGQWQLQTAAIELSVCLVFVARDILFLQWVSLTQMKRPVVKGVLYLMLYYIAAGILAGVVSTVSKTKSQFLFGVFTPSSAFTAGDPQMNVLPGIYVGLVLQLFFIVLLLRAIGSRLSRPAIVPAISEG